MEARSAAASRDGQHAEMAETLQDASCCLALCGFLNIEGCMI